MNLEGIIFDLDGTLADTLPVCFVAFRQAIETFTGRRLIDEERGLRLAIVTGKGAQSTAISLRDLALDGLFDVVETGAPSGRIKSDRSR